MILARLLGICITRCTKSPGKQKQICFCNTCNRNKSTSNAKQMPTEWLQNCSSRFGSKKRNYKNPNKSKKAYNLSYNRDKKPLRTWSSKWWRSCSWSQTSFKLKATLWARRDCALRGKRRSCAETSRTRSSLWLRTLNCALLNWNLSINKGLNRTVFYRRLQGVKLRLRLLRLLLNWNLK